MRTNARLILSVTTSTDIAPRKDANELLARIGWAALICVTLYVCYFSHLGAIGFVGPDEPRYAWIARDMAETGAWVTPRLYGKPWFEKPPLYYWGAAICFKLFGVSEAAARLPSAISALLATLAMAWLACRIYDAGTARWLLLLLPTTVGMIGFSHAAATDMPFSAMLTIAMVCAAVLLRLPLECGGLPPLSPNKACATESTGTLATAPASSSFISFTSFTSSTSFPSLLFGFFLGLAVLAKGPAAIILCGGAIFFWALFTKRWRDALRLFHPAAIAAFCVTALPWYILCARRNTDFFRIFIIEHNFKRYLTPEFQHIQPFWFYGPIIFLSIFPWSFLAVLGLVDLLRLNLPAKEPTSWFLLSWSAFTVFFFTISQSKLPGYILPALPPLVFLATDLWARRAGRDSVLAGISLFTGALALIGAAVLVIRVRRLPAESLFAEAWVWRWIAGIACAGLLVCFLALSRRKALSTLATCILVLSGVELSNRYLLPRLDQVFSARAVTPLLVLWHDDDIRACVYELQPSWAYGLNFYAHRELPECAFPVSLSVQAIVSEKGLNDLFRMEKEQPQRVRVRPFSGGRIGQNIYLVGIRPPLATHPPGSGKPQ
jgi:4-amino-4-deoxy-L-arabinose transferase-like glycosyltransferase